MQHIFIAFILDIYWIVWYFFYQIFLLQVPDEAVTKCTSCGTDFGAFVRRVIWLFMYLSLCWQYWLYVLNVIWHTFHSQKGMTDMYILFCTYWLHCVQEKEINIWLTINWSGYWIFAASLQKLRWYLLWQVYTRENCTYIRKGCSTCSSLWQMPGMLVYSVVA